MCLVKNILLLRSNKDKRQRRARRRLWYVLKPHNSVSLINQIHLHYEYQSTCFNLTKPIFHVSD